LRFHDILDFVFPIQNEKIANRGYVLETGKITNRGTGQALLADEHVKTAYLGV